ncbi:hypothetical protein PsorP6_009795 [Peronosclerospora sorghi]|uniref:Uncharacterized protein n=1 Tax=Peronosclerospora sorghi TaxID=230839 RepID=A0ACC0VZJ1_9STRA|nr:hypothetical protein PsorP6_009795 [Peronosclerospora sorghi]
MQPCHPLVVIVAAHLFAPHDVLSASEARKLLRVDALNNATTDARNVTAKEERVPISFKWLEDALPSTLPSHSTLASDSTESSPSLLRSPSTLSSDSTGSYPWSTSTRSDPTFSRSASTLSSRTFRRSASALSSGTFSRSASTLSSGTIPLSASMVSYEHAMLRFVDEWVELEKPEEKPAKFVLKQLEMDQLAGNAFTSAPNFMYYDKYVSDLVLHWVEEEKPLYYVLEQLGMDDLAGNAFTSAPNFMYYDKFVSDLVLQWVKKERTLDQEEGTALDQVMRFLGVQYLRQDALKASPEFKYVDEYLQYKVEVWASQDLSIDDVLKELKLDLRSGAALKEAWTYVYYEGFVIRQIRKWLEDGSHVDDVLEHLGLDKLNGKELVRHHNYKFYKAFVKNKLKQWARSRDEDSIVAVMANLGLTGLKGDVLEKHRNFPFLVEYERNRRQYRIEPWLKNEVPTLEIWEKLEVNRVHRNRRSSISTSYSQYKDYVEALDKYIIHRYNSIVPKKLKVQSDFDPDELREKVKIWSTNGASRDYVKSALGLHGLSTEEFRKAPTFAYYVQYLGTRKREP